MPTVRHRYLESTQKDRDTGNYTHEAELVLTNWLTWSREREPPVTSTGNLDVSVLGEWAQSLKRRTHAGGVAGTTAHTYYAIVSASLSWAVKWEYLEDNPALKQRAQDELPEPGAGETPDAQFWSSEERQTFCRFVDRRAEQAVDERGLGAVAELRDRALVYLLEGVIESISYRNDGASWIVSAFVVGDGNDES